MGAFDVRVAALEEAVREAGRSNNPPERGVLVFQMYRDLADVGPDDWIAPESVATSPYTLVGDAAAMTDAIIRRRATWGITYVVCFDRDLEKMLPVARRLSGS